MQPIVMRYLYRSPPLTAVSLLQLTESVLRGDKKWDDTRLHPHSIPGRYVRTLDLSTISLTMTDFGDDFIDDPSSARYGNGGTPVNGRGGGQGPSPHVTAIARACAALMPLLPNVTHVKLPPVGGGAGYEAILRTIRRAPFVSKLRAVEGLQVPGSAVLPVNPEGGGVVDTETTGAPGRLEWPEGEALLGMLREMRDVEYLSFAGQGLGADTWPNGSADLFHPDALPSDALPPLDLPRLHTLRVDSLPTSPLLAILASSSLPSLSRLLITSYTLLPLDSPALVNNTHCPDLSLAMFAAHGHKLRSLTLLPTREWPPAYPLPPDEVFDRYCTDARHVSILLPLAAFMADKEGAARLGRAIGRKDSKVKAVTLAKWAQRSGGSPSPSPHVQPGGLPILNGNGNVHGHGTGGAMDAGLGLGGLTIGGNDQNGHHQGSGTSGKKLAQLPRTHPFLSALITAAHNNATVPPASAAPSSLPCRANDPSAGAVPLPSPLAPVPRPRLQSVTIDGLTSVSPHLSFAARDAGANGEMRQWAIGMAQRGIEMLDGSGQGVLSQYHALVGIPETPRATPWASGTRSPSLGSAVGSWSGSAGAAEMSPIAAMVAAGMGIAAPGGARRGSAGEWDERGRRRSRGGAGAPAGMGYSVYGVHGHAYGHTHAGRVQVLERGEEDEDGG